MCKMQAEELRRQYRPDNVRVLMVGESPPVGGTFFYAANSNLFRHTKAAFEKALRRTWSPDEAFLQFFSREGFFLDDLCLHPVNGLPNAERRRARKAQPDFRLSHDQKRMIEQAAATSQSVSDFAITQLVQATRRTIDKITVSLVLVPRARERYRDQQRSVVRDAELSVPSFAAK